ncbi:hypothetical protein HNQ85_000811 [Anoxybacillus calidus]|uniref:Uncharacterized protein n=1 Tax=[Anoxybacillus] calidus TaxID=575178 RepID=A0A7V9YYD8_9BACL|nr:hypothetical protein [Anoxybacillus calidus]
MTVDVDVSDALKALGKEANKALKVLEELQQKKDEVLNETMHDQRREDFERIRNEI